MKLLDCVGDFCVNLISQDLQKTWISNLAYEQHAVGQVDAHLISLLIFCKRYEKFDLS